MNTIENKTTTATTEAAQDAAAEVKTMTSSMELVTVGEVLDRDFLVPTFQRPFQWKTSQIDLLCDSLMKGIPLPAIIIARITFPDGHVELLLIDGVQRTTALRKLVEGCDTSEAGQTALEAILSGSIWIMYVDCPTLEMAAELFVRYNNGAALSGAQRNKADLPPVKLEAVAPYIKRLGEFNFTKLGKVTPDTAAIMLAAAAVSVINADYKDKASTSGASAAKVLKAAPRIPALERMEGFNAAISAVAKTEDKAKRALWASPARLVPLAMAAEAVKADEAALSKLIDGANMESAESVTVVHKGKTDTTTVSAAFADKSNAAKATAARRDAIAHLLTKADKGEAAAVKATAAALAGMVKGAKA